ncbi:MAG: radical SAM protein [Candidatus Rifleibacteriota bacterium]
MDLDRLKRSMWLRQLYLKLKLPLEFPMILNIEPTNRCNLACSFCPRKTSQRPEYDLDWSLFLRLVAELKKEGPILRVFLQKDGEPLLYARLVEMVEILRKINAARVIAVITNGVLLTEEKFLGLAAAGLDDLIVSIDANRAEDYKLLKGADCYDKVVGNVLNAIHLKKKLGLIRPNIKVRMVERAGQQSEVKIFKKFWHGKADFVDITPFHTWLGAVDDERCYNVTDRYPCSLLWYTGVVNSDGRVSPCCIDYDCAGCLDDLAGKSFREIWNGRSFNKLRRLHLLGKYHETSICGPCEYWQIKENIGSWLKRKYRISSNE